MPLDQLAREYEYRIESGSARKPNKAGRIEALQIALQTLGPILQPVAMQGQVGPLNALLKDYCEAIDVDYGPYMIPEPPPPPPPPDAASAPASPADGEGGGEVPATELQQVPPELQ
jgi:hypothetical protein